MAFHNHHYHCHPPAAAATISCCCCGGGGCYSKCCTSYPPPDSLLHQSPPPYVYSPYLSPPYDAQNFLHHHHQTAYQPPLRHQQKQEGFRLPHQYDPQQQETQPISAAKAGRISSLLSRITALESSLRHQLPANHSYTNSLRHAAARIIQTHFRAFLARRSRTLRQLKDLASIKSNLNALKASLSDNAYLDSQLLSARAMDLLLRLDSIQGGDPMIRESKRSIGRGLSQFLEFIDGASVKRNKISGIGLKNARLAGTGNKSSVLYSNQELGAANFVNSCGDERELIEKLRTRVKKMHIFPGVSEGDDNELTEIERPRILTNGVTGSSRCRNGDLVKRHCGDQTKIKKRVSFADNVNASRVFMTSHEPSSSEDINGIDGSGSSDDEPEGLMNNLGKEVQEIGGIYKGSEDDEEACTDEEESPQISDGDRNPRRI